MGWVNREVGGVGRGNGGRDIYVRLCELYFVFFFYVIHFCIIVCVTVGGEMFIV